MNECGEVSYGGEADLCVATEAIAEYPDLISMPVYQWNRCVVVPPKHPLLKTPLTLEQLVQYPIVTYDFAFANQHCIDDAVHARAHGKRFDRSEVTRNRCDVFNKAHAKPGRSQSPQRGFTSRARTAHINLN